MDRFWSAFERIDDPRTGDWLEHDLREVLFIALCASLCGAESSVDMAAFAATRCTASAPRPRRSWPRASGGDYLMAVKATSRRCTTTSG